MDEESLPMLELGLEAIQWPADFSGQQLFIQGEDWQYNAMLNWSHFRADLYAFAYKDAADGLVEAMANRQVPSSTTDSQQTVGWRRPSKQAERAGPQGQRREDGSPKGRDMAAPGLGTRQPLPAGARPY